MSARHNRKQMEVFGLSFLDIICCGFGAIVLLLLISPVGGMGDAPSNPENTAELQSEFFALNASIKSVITLIEPLMIIILGSIIGTIAIALLLPVFKISSVIAQ